MTDTPPPSLDDAAPDLADLVRRVSDGHELTVPEARAAIGRFMKGQASPVLMAALLTALRTRSVAATEVAGGVLALKDALIPVPARDPEGLVDTAGTGGGALTTFNISTAAALVAAGSGVRLAKHGNRSFTSRSGSADVLEALGVRIDLTPERMGEILEEVGIVFMFAPLLHPAMRHVGPVRRELGMPTLMNLLGPLSNPAGAQRQVVGVSDPELVPLVVASLRELGHVRAMVVHGHPGLDEVSPLGSTRVAELATGEVRRYELHPEELGLPVLPAEGLEGGEPEDNAARIRDVLSGADQGVARVAVLLNAAAAIYVSDRAPTLPQALAAAREALDSGAARDKLEALRLASIR
ncbi:MAG TPA: anthranilate phosphoribosyltransferase [Longimicrobiales bacterium]|nr:anthranilate phosphoribosyltransferase [Longimicrobiales bacterium]